VNQEPTAAVDSEETIFPANEADMQEIQNQDRRRMGPGKSSAPLQPAVIA